MPAFSFQGASLGLGRGVASLLPEGERCWPAPSLGGNTLLLLGEADFLRSPAFPVPALVAVTSHGGRFTSQLREEQESRSPPGSGQGYRASRGSW